MNDQRFSEGPIYVGRQPQCQVFLPDRAVSRQHAVIFTTTDGVWMVHDLDSANRTLVNGRPIKKIPLHEGDVITIADFMLEVHLDVVSRPVVREQQLDLGDTVLDDSVRAASIYTRDVRQKTDRPIRLAMSRITDFYNLSVSLNRLSDQESLLAELIKIILPQFQAYHVWGGLRETTSGPLSCYGGCSRGGGLVDLEDLVGKNLIRQSLQNESYVLLPNINDILPPAEQHVGLESLCSAMVAPISAPAGTYGILYLDNGSDQPPYSQQDLDYLTMVVTHLAALLETVG